MPFTTILKYSHLLVFLFLFGSCRQVQNNELTAVIIAPETIEAGHVFSVDATTSTAGTSPITSYTWDFGDGAISHAAKVNYSYGNGGKYELVLTVTDETGTNHTAQQTIQVTQIAGSTPPTAVIDGPATAMVGETVTFHAGNSLIGSNPISKFNWYSGDGKETGDTIQAVFTTSYVRPGTFTPLVTLFDNQGLSDSTTMEIIILEPKS